MSPVSLPSPASGEDERFAHLSLYQRELVSRLGWLIRLRWIGVTGLLLGLCYARLGLGLTMCKSIVDSHRGEIAVSSVPNHRTDFTARIPLSQPR